MTLKPLDMQMSVIEGYYDDGQEVAKTYLIDDDSYVKDKALLNIIKDVYDKQNVLNAKYNVSIPKNLYDYINCYIYKYYKIHELLKKEHFTYLDIYLYNKITHVLTSNEKNQFPSDVAIIYFIDDEGIQAFDTPTKNEVIESIRQLIKKQ